MPDRPRETASERAERLYGELGADLYRYAVMLVADPASAEDAIQQVFALLLRHSGSIENETHYLRRAVRNECYSMLRGRVRQRNNHRLRLRYCVINNRISKCPARRLSPSREGRRLGQRRRRPLLIVERYLRVRVLSANWRDSGIDP